VRGAGGRQVYIRFIASFDEALGLLGPSRAD
jgi:hypothetical protein